MLLHICANLWVKIPKFGGQKNLTTFWQLKNPKKSALFGPANGQSLTYSKSQTRVCRLPWSPPMDWFLIKSVNAEYPLSCRKCVENGHFVFYALLDPLSVSHPPKMVPPYSLGTCPATNPETLWCQVTPSSRENWFSEDIFFFANYSNGPGVAKNWHMSKLTKNGPRKCYKVSWVQIWQKNSNGKCPKLPKRNSCPWCY